MAKKKPKMKIVKLRLDKEVGGLIALIAKMSDESEGTVIRVLLSVGILRHMAMMQGEKKPAGAG